MSVYGYIRKNDVIDTDNQMTALTPYACDQIFIENIELDGSKELVRLLSNVKKQDVIVVYNLQIFFRQLREFNRLIEEMVNCDLQLVCIEDDIKLRDLFHYSSLLIDMDYEFRSQNIKKHIERARQEGKIGGRPTITEQTIERIRHLFHKKQMSMKEIASICEVSVGTVSKYVK